MAGAISKKDNMLKQSHPYTGSFKLNSGEEFIATVIAEGPVSYTVTKPRCIVPTDRGVQYVPLMMLANQDEPVEVPKPVLHAKAADAFAKQYESTLSPIAVPAKQSIIV